MNSIKLYFLSVLIVYGAFNTSLSIANNLDGIHPLLSDSLAINLGGFSANHEVTAKYGANNSGDSIDFERDLGMENDKTIPTANIIWRPFNKHQFQFEYFGWSDSTTFAIDKAIEWGDQTYNIGNVKTKEDFDVYRLFYGYNFFKNNSYEVGLGVGIHVADLELSLREQNVPAQTASGVAPVPNLGIYGSYALSDKWLLHGRADWFDMSIDEYDGELTNASASVQYQAFDHFGIGVLYRYVDFEIERDTEQLDWSANMTFEGPSLFITSNF